MTTRHVDTHQPPDWALKPTLKRGALLAAANWPVILVQFAAESMFKLLLAVPLLGGALLIALALGGDLRELLTGDLRQILANIGETLLTQPVTLIAFVLAFGIVLVGGSTLMFLIKGGTVATLIAGERTAGPIERPPLRLAMLRRGSQFSVEEFVDSAVRLFRRYLVLGFALLLLYAISGAIYLLGVIEGYRFIGDAGFFLEWTAVAAFCSTALMVWITIWNLLYLLVQIAIAADDLGVREGVFQVGRFLRHSGREVALVFLVILGLVLVATVVSILTAAGLGLISFVPFAGLAVFPLQAAAWLLRGLVFQYLGLSGLCSYLTLYRRFSPRPALAITGDRAVPSIIRSA